VQGGILGVDFGEDDGFAGWVGGFFGQWTGAFSLGWDRLAEGDGIVREFNALGGSHETFRRMGMLMC
jgi:hypothetical protein